MNHNSQRNKIHDYLNNTLSKNERNEFEKELENNSFLKEAVEGYHTYKASPEDLQKIDNKILNSTKNKSLIYLSTAAVIAMLITSIFVFKNLNTNNNSSHIIADYDSDNLEKPLIPEDSIINSDTSINALKYEILEKPKIAINEDSLEPLFRLERRKLALKPEKHKSEITHYFVSNHIYTYLASFKIVDYRTIKRVQSDKFNIPTNSHNNTNIASLNTPVTYLSVLENSFLLYKNKNYNKALDNFELILEQYPNDLNAIFYSGMCYIELDDNKSAKQYLQKAKNHDINTFSEESNWYIAKIFKEEKLFAETEAILNEIINDQGYYGAQAKYELENLYK